jgi:hypothetical protein
MATTALPGKPLGGGAAAGSAGDEGSPSYTKTMICEGCLHIRPWTPWLRCSRECYELPRATAQEQAAAIAAAPEAFAYFASQPIR